jgi:predicted nucleotidyltransferase component of viral defense system
LLLVLGPRQIVELFHLLFVRSLFAGLPDKTRVAIKGGINLRFYFQSVRFSEDLDMDVMSIAKETLENRVDRLLTSTPLLSPLKSRGLVLREISKPKQTDTVQKWKVGVAALDGSVQERTKIEFSRRDDVTSAKFEKVDPAIANAYSIPAFLATHYTAPDAVRQKIHALAGRVVTQPRDVFDLNVLFARPDAPAMLDDEAKTWLEPAVANVEKLTYDQYAALVLAYLEPEHLEIYQSSHTWEAMQLDVIGRLDALR